MMRTILAGATLVVTLAAGGTFIGSDFQASAARHANSSPGSLLPVSSALGKATASSLTSTSGRFSARAARLQSFGRGSSGNPSASGNGRYIVFYGNGNDANTRADLFLRDIRKGRTRRIATGGSISSSAISADGRFVVYETWRLPGNPQEIFLYDVRSRDTRLVHRSTEPHGSLVTISGDGRYLAFAHNERSLPAFVYVYDRLAELTTAIEVEGANAPVISQDGRYATFILYTVNNGALYSYEFATGAVIRVSPASSTFCGQGSMSSDGRYIVMNCTEGGQQHILQYDRTTGQTKKIDRSRSLLLDPTISGNGRHIAYTACGSLGRKDTNGTCDVVVVETRTGKRTVPSLGGNGSSRDPYLAADGMTIVFTSDASNLAPGDTDKTSGIFHWTR